MDKKGMTRHHISLSPVVLEKLNTLEREKGLSKSALISIAIDKYYQSLKGEIHDSK